MTPQENAMIAAAQIYDGVNIVSTDRDVPPGNSNEFVENESEKTATSTKCGSSSSSSSSSNLIIETAPTYYTCGNAKFGWAKWQR